jgi:uncharacterized protein YqeY
MTIVEQIDRDLAAAMKAREQLRLSAIRMIKTALKMRQTEIEGPMGDEEELRVLNSLLKQRRDAAEQYRAAGREDRAAQEESEALVIQSYLPAAASDDEMAAAVAEAIRETGASSPKDMGAVMKSVRSKLAGKTVDGKSLSELVKTRLS